MEPHILSAAAIAQRYAYPAMWDSPNYPWQAQTLRYTHYNASVATWRIEGKLIVGIAGTDDIRDWLDNLKLTDEAISPGIAAHAGMLDYTRAVNRALRSVDPQKFETVIIAGHSLGGAAAQMLPLINPKWEQAIYRGGQIVAFGSPRWCRTESVDRYLLAPAVTRIVRELDIVPDVPVSKLFTAGRLAGWSHVGEERYYTSNDEPSLRTTAREAYRRLKRFTSFSVNPLGMWSLINGWHSSEKYMELVQ